MSSKTNGAVAKSLTETSILDVWDDMLTGKNALESILRDENSEDVFREQREVYAERGVCGVGRTCPNCFRSECENYEESKKGLPK